MRHLIVLFLLFILIFPVIGKEPILQNSQVKIQEGDRPVFIKIPLEKFAVEIHPFIPYNCQNDPNLHRGDENFFPKFLAKVLNTVENPKIIFTPTVDNNSTYEGQKLLVDGNFTALDSGEYILDIRLYDTEAGVYLNGWNSIRSPCSNFIILSLIHI